MANISIDGTDYDIDSLSDDAKGQIASIRFVDNEVVRLKAQIAALSTARIAYSRALKEILEKGSVSEQEEVSVDGLGENVTFD